MLLIPKDLRIYLSFFVFFRHSALDAESRELFYIAYLWIPASAGMTEND